MTNKLINELRVMTHYVTGMLTLLVLIIATATTAFAGGKVEAQAAQGVVVYKSANQPNRPPKQGGTLTVRATATGVVTFRPPEKCLAPRISRNGRCLQPPQIAIVPSELPGGNVETPYPVVQFVANGGTRPHTITLADGALPPGLKLTDSGRISGTPTKVGAFGFVIQAIDSQKFTGTRAYSISIQKQQVVSCVSPEVRRDGVCVRPPEITIAPSELPGGVEGERYSSVQFVANGGARPHSFTLTAGSLPPGLILTPSGMLSGKPTQNGAFGFVMEATDGQKFTGTKAYSISIAEPKITTCSSPEVLRDGACIRPPAISISPSELPGAKFDAPYTPVQFVANGGSRPHTFALRDGALPRGLAITAAGLLSGTPGERGSFSFTISATDSKQFSGTRAYSISIADAPVVNDKPDPCPKGQVRFGANCVAGGPSQPPVLLVTPTKKDPEDSVKPGETDDIAKLLQQELKRLGCLDGAVDGIWGSGSRAALSRFASLAKLRINTSEPSEAALTAADAKSTGYCKRDAKPKGCREGYYRNRKGQCEKEELEPCRRGYYRNDNDQCVRKAPIGCREGYTLKNGRCEAVRLKPCPRGYSHNEGGDCERDEQEVRCGRGFYKKNNQCVRIQVRCNPGYVERNGNCYPIQIRCNRGYQASNGRCVPIQCGRNQYLNDEGKCVIRQLQCRRGFQPRNGQCVPVRPNCRGGQYYDQERRTCRCEGDRVFNPRAQRCVPRGQQGGGNRRGNEGGRNNYAAKKAYCIQRCAPSYQNCMRITKNANACEVVAQRCWQQAGCAGIR